MNNSENINGLRIRIPPDERKLHPKDIRIAELEKEVAKLKLHIKTTDYNSINNALCEHCWHLDFSESLVDDWWKDEYDKNGWDGLYICIKRANMECVYKNNCKQCSSILAIIRTHSDEQTIK